MIPKIIHQTWKTREIPEQWQSAVESVKLIHPDYEYILWTDETMTEFVKSTYPDFYPNYLNYKYNIQRCDAFRYLVLYKYGGIYLDMDIACKKKIDGLLHYDLVLAKSSNISTTYTNSFFMCEPEHPFIKFCIKQLPKYTKSFVYLGKHNHIMNSTGPIFLMKMVKNYDKKNIANFYVLTEEEFAGDCNVCHETTCVGGTYFKHLVGNSWHSWDSTFYNLLLCHYKTLLLVLAVLVGGGWLYKGKNVKLRRKLKY